MAILFASMKPTNEELFTNLRTGRDRIQATFPLLLQFSFSTAASFDLSGQELTLATWARMAILTAVVVPTRECAPTNGIAREEPVHLLEITLHRHIAANHDLSLLLAEA